MKLAFRPAARRHVRGAGSLFLNRAFGARRLPRLNLRRGRRVGGRSGVNATLPFTLPKTGLARNRRARLPKAAAGRGTGSRRFREFLCLATSLLALGPLPGSMGMAASATASLRAYAEQSQHRQAYGVYVKNRKFGWAIDELTLGKRGGKDVALATFEMHGSFTSAGERSRSDLKSVTGYSLEGDGEIVFVEERNNEDGNETVLTVEREGSDAIVRTRSRGGETTRRVPAPKETLSLTRELETWLTRPPKKGTRFVNYSAAWDRDDINVKEIYTFRGRKPILWGGVKTEVYQVAAKVDGVLMDFEVAADGTPLKGVVGGIFELRAEKETLAKSPEAQPIDMLEASAIASNKDLGEPERIESLTLEIRGLGNFNLPQSHRQRVRSRRGQTMVVELVRDGRDGKSVPLSPMARASYVKSTPTLQADHAAIRAQAREIVDGASGELEQTDRLQEWVFRYVRQTMAANQTTALDVLQTRAGDCTEITMLFVALARAAGIPAREVGGVMYANEGAPIFGWHAWAEIHDGHQWVSVDPTWNELYVDATHLKLSEDSNDLAWVNLLGKMRFQVVKFTSRQ